MLRTIYLNIFCALITAVSLVGCGYSYTEKVADVDPILWRVDDTARIEIDGRDTAELYCIDFLMTFNAEFDKRPVTINIAVIAPDSTRLFEGIRLSEFPTCHKHSAYSNLCYTYRDSVKFGQQGTYFFDISPARAITGVKSVGINVRNIKNGKE